MWIVCLFPRPCIAVQQFSKFWKAWHQLQKYCRLVWSEQFFFNTHYIFVYVSFYQWIIFTFCLFADGRHDGGMLSASAHQDSLCLKAKKPRKARTAFSDHQLQVIDYIFCIGIYGAITKYCPWLRQWKTKINNDWKSRALIQYSLRRK